MIKAKSNNSTVGISAIVATGGDKGGVGKSFTSRVVTGWLLAKGLAVHGFDGDSRNPHLERFYGKSIPVDRPALRAIDGWSSMYGAWERIDRCSTIVVDLPGNIGDMVAGELDRLPLIAKALDRKLVSIWVANEEEDSIWLLQESMRVFPPDATLFVMNGRFGSAPSNFELWQKSKTRAAFLEGGGRETLLPPLPIFPRTAIAKHRAPFHDVTVAGLSLTETVDFQMWWAAAGKALAPLAAMLEIA